ncbi:MAG: class I SAM-dependent methyltransferase [Gammaproteobacteria bacterium]|nr:class I SAM-dependent methyltransferase [Gammaproteobacteria bacterium]
MMQAPKPQTCPLCHGGTPSLFAEVRGSPYYQCNTCHLIFLDPQLRPDPDAEKAHYDTHDNDPADPGYRNFLWRLAEPLLAKLEPGAEGLDYGAGPGPTLSIMLEERGFPMTIHDPFYDHNPAALERRYDFITCTETAEHFFNPGEEFQRLDRLLKPNGWLGLMTLRRDPDKDFASWHYLRDPTHVCFYDDETLEWIADHFGWQLEIISNSVALFHRRPGIRAVSNS